MASKETNTVASPPLNHHQSAQEPSVLPSKSQLDSDISDSPPLNLEPTNTSSTDSDEKPFGQPAHFAAIRGASRHDDEEYDLERTASQIHGGLSNDERAELRQIASIHRTKTTATQPDLERTDTLAGVSDDDPRLDPDKPEFDIYVWARAFIQAQNESGIKDTKPGFTFKDLNVTGSGSALSLQANVASVFMAPFRLNEYVNFGHKPHKQILRDFNGLVKSGEMLIVLGRPGSGCSTFLKTICGELSGLELDSASVVHYDGKHPSLHSPTLRP